MFKCSEFISRERPLSNKQNKEKEKVFRDLVLQVPGKEGNISAAHSLSFEELCIVNGYVLNKQFPNNTAIRYGKNRKQIIENAITVGACKVAVLSPSEKEMDKLADKLNLEMIRNFGVNYAVVNDSQFMKIFELFMELKKESTAYESFISANGNEFENWIGTSNMAPMNEINKASIVVEIIYGDLRMFFTGDSGSELWYEYLEKEYQVIKLSHHGTTRPNKVLLDSTRGEILLISTNDSIFYPVEGVKYALIELWNQAEEGELTFEELQIRMQQIADWISTVEKAVGEGQPEWVGYY